MIFRLMHYFVLPLYVLFVIYSSISLGKTEHAVLLASLGAIFTFSIFSDRRYPHLFKPLAVVQLLLLFCFHLTAELNWCFSLYIILLSKVLPGFQGLVKSTLLGFAFVFFYTCARITYTPITAYNVLAVVSDLLTSFAVVLIIQHIIDSEREKNLLKEELRREEMTFQSEKMKLVGELAAGMAHEIRNPLTTIKGFLQIAKNKEYNVKTWYDLLIYELDRMSQLTDEFLQFSKPRASDYRTHPLNLCIGKVISLTEPQVNRMGHQIIFEEEGGELCVQMDLDKMLQVFLNLVKNAYEAMSNNGKVMIRLYKEGNIAVVKVSDMGTGIRQADLAQIFTPFFTTKNKGTGLGLSICQKIVSDHGGKIEVSSVVNQGTTFTVSLPLHTTAGER